MAVSRKLTTFLRKSRVTYKTLKHKQAFTAQEIAGVQHVPGKQVVKSVLLKSDKGFCLAVLPAINLVDFAKLKTILRAKKVSLATEGEIAKIFPDFEVGAMPPFTALGSDGASVSLLADAILKEDKEIVFNAGTHTETVKIKFKAFEKLAKPKFASFGKHV